MATPTKFSPKRSRGRLVRQFNQLQRILQAQLDRLNDKPEEVSAALLGTVVDGLRKTAALLEDIERIHKKEATAEAVKRDSEETLAQLPFSKQQDPSVPPSDDGETLGLELPFPKAPPITGLKVAVVTKE